MTFYKLTINSAATRELNKITKKDKSLHTLFYNLCESLSQGETLPAANRYKSVGGGAFEFTFGDRSVLWCRGLLERNSKEIHIYSIEKKADMAKNGDLSAHQSQRRKWF